MPTTKTDKKDLKQRDFKTLQRIEYFRSTSDLLKEFFEAGFRSFDALKTIVVFYFPDVDERKLWNYWQFKIMSQEISDVLLDVFEKLKKE